jgi:hypothetical protein
MTPMEFAAVVVSVSDGLTVRRLLSAAERPYLSTTLSYINKVDIVVVMTVPVAGRHHTEGTQIWFLADSLVGPG